MFQGLIDLERFDVFNKRDGKRLVDHLKNNSVGTPFKISFYYRKRNTRPFYTFIRFDALTALKEYLSVRNYPQEGEAIVLNIEGNALSKKAIQRRHSRFLRNLKFIPDSNNTEVDTGNRYGFGIHELTRDLPKTTLHLQGKNEGLDMSAINFLMGHVTDSLGYDRFYKDEQYMLQQYRIAEKYLNIVSRKGERDELWEKAIHDPDFLERLAVLLREKQKEEMK